MPVGTPTRTISSELLATLGSETSTLAGCIKIQPAGAAAVVGLTTFDDTLEIDGVTYYPDPGLSATELVAVATYAVDNLEISGAFDDEVIARADALAGVYDDAAYELFIVDYDAPASGSMILQRGSLGNVDIVDDLFTLELRSQSQKLQEPVGESTSPTCRAQIFDVRCMLDEDGTHPTLGIAYKFTAQAVLSVTSRFVFTFTNHEVIPAGYFIGGKLLWTDGNNNLQRSEVKDHTVDDSEHTITLQEPTYYAFTVADQFTIWKGCRKRFVDCKDVENVENMRAEIYLPGLVETLRRP